MKETLVRVRGIHKSGSPFVVGLVVTGGKVIQAGPIIAYMRGWTLENVRNHCKAKKWSVDVILGEENLAASPRRPRAAIKGGKS